MLADMRNTLDFSSLAGLLTTLLGLVVVSLVAVSIRLLVMTGVQQRRERQNRQINERLKTLIAAYKTLGGSFTGDLTVDPTHLRDLRARADAAAAALGTAEAQAALEDAAGAAPVPVPRLAPDSGSDRRRRIRDAVEAALSDVMLLGTAEQVTLAVKVANDMVAGRPVETAELVTSLRLFIREVLDLEAMPEQLQIPRQGPVRAGGGSGAKGGGGEGKAGGGGGGAGGGAGAGGGGGGGMPVLGRDTHGDPGAEPH